MAVLNAHPKTPRRARWRTWVLGAFVFLTGCMIVDVLAGHERPFKFSHKIHSAEQELECGDCHRVAAGKDTPGLPVQKQCQLCHEAIDAKKPPERHVSTLYDGKEFKASHVSRLPAENVFSHGKHTGANLACATCHTGIEQSEAIDANVAVPMDRCIACHDERKVGPGSGSGQCAICHKEIRTDARPPTHDPAWLRIHGRSVRGASEAVADRCTMCHTEATCTSCHREVPPQNHNNYFRLRGHGVIARMDRELCATCHRPDSCDRCHAETKPLSHSGSWGGTQSNHCRSCHLPLRTDECAVCHKNTPSHELAAAKPAWHNAGMNCRQCHGLTIRLPHPDKGDDCNGCHR